MMPDALLSLGVNTALIDGWAVKAPWKSVNACVASHVPALSSTDCLAPVSVVAVVLKPAAAKTVL